MATTDSLIAANLQTLGSAENTWGTGSGGLNESLQKLDRAIAGYLAKSVAGNSNVTLTQTESENAVIELTGALTGNIEVRPVSAGAKWWIVFNNTTGAFTVTFVPSGASGVVIEQGKKRIVYSNGTNIVDVLDFGDITFGDVTLLSTDAGATGAPDLILDRDSASPAAADVLGRVIFRGEDSGGADQDYAQVQGAIGDPTAASEDGKLSLQVTVAGIMTDVAVLQPEGLTLPLQPAFLAYNSAPDTNQTGDGTAATVDFDTEVYDRGDNFAGDTFTAPVAGIYHFDVAVRLTGLASGNTTGQLSLVTSNRTVLLDHCATGAQRAADNSMVLKGSIDLDMDAADTAHVTVSVQGGTKIVGIEGTTAPHTFFSGRLVA